MKPTKAHRAYLKMIIAETWGDALLNSIDPYPSSYSDKILQALLDDPRVVLQVLPEGVHQMHSIVVNEAPPRFVPIPVIVQPY